MKILIISPKFHPIEDGLAQYTKCFRDELKNSHEVEVLTSRGVNNSEVNNSIDCWDWRGLSKINYEVEKIKPDRVLIQYVPFMYAKRGGINFGIVFLFLYWRLFKKFKIDIMYHELSYPFQLNPKAIIMYTCHHMMLFISGFASHKLFCSTEFFTNYVNRFFLKLKDVIHLQVGSNISGQILSEEERRVLKSKYCNNEQILIGCFGSFHPSKDYNPVFKAIIDSESNVKLIFIGSDHKNLIENYPFLENNNQVQGIGFLSNSKAFEHLQVLDGFIAYFVDGVTTRRGSLIAALDFEFPIFTTGSSTTEDIFKQIDQVMLLPTNPHKFQEELSFLLNTHSHKEKYFNSEEQIKIKEFFSWSLIVKKYLNNI